LIQSVKPHDTHIAILLNTLPDNDDNNCVNST